MRFSYEHDVVLDGVDLAVGAGEFVALVGANGSGKSTLLRILLGLIRPDAGAVSLFGAPPAALRDRSRLGYVPQNPSAASGIAATVEEVVATGLLARGWKAREPANATSRTRRAEVDHALESTAIADLRRRRIGELSGGQQQRAWIAKALVHRPDLLLLDEPVAGVDSRSQELFRDALVHLQSQHGAAVLLVSHELGAVADDLDRVCVLQAGRMVFDGKPEELSATGVHLGVHRTDLPLWLEREHGAS